MILTGSWGVERQQPLVQDHLLIIHSTVQMVCYVVWRLFFGDEIFIIFYLFTQIVSSFFHIKIWYIWLSCLHLLIIETFVLQ